MKEEESEGKASFVRASRGKALQTTLLSLCAHRVLHMWRDSRVAHWEGLRRGEAASPGSRRSCLLSSPLAVYQVYHGAGHSPIHLLGSSYPPDALHRRRRRTSALDCRLGDGIVWTRCSGTSQGATGATGTSDMLFSSLTATMWQQRRDSSPLRAASLQRGPPRPFPLPLLPLACHVTSGLQEAAAVDRQCCTANLYPALTLHACTAQPDHPAHSQPLARAHLPAVRSHALTETPRASAQASR